LQQKVLPIDLCVCGADLFETGVENRIAHTAATIMNHPIRISTQMRALVPLPAARDDWSALPIGSRHQEKGFKGMDERKAENILRNTA
jgi:hypothetical protein